jgi:4'-phosphopantetheinyl transferase EntD
MRRLRISLPAWRPTLAEIHSAPELAPLAMVYGSIHTAAFAIGAAYPELAQLDLDLDPFEASAELRQIAARILTDLELLARSIDAYRVANTAVPSNRHLSEDDFPF